MPSKYFTLLSAAFLSVATTGNAQELNKAPRQFNNTVKIATASVHLPHETKGFRPLSQAGAFYERRIAGHWSAGIGYMRWRDVPNGLGYEVRIGGLAFRQAYDMFDIYCVYNHRFRKLNHAVSAGLGVAYTRGLNVYFAGPQTTPYGEDWVFNSKDETFPALVPQLSYNYRFLRNRLQLGADFRLRYYFNKVRPQYEPGVHIGFMF